MQKKHYLNFEDYCMDIAAMFYACIEIQYYVK